MVYSREQFLKDNPDKKMLYVSSRFISGYGTSKYIAEWQGDWTVEELVNYVDNSTGNYGGRIENLMYLPEGTYKGIVCVYYD